MSLPSYSVITTHSPFPVFPSIVARDSLPSDAIVMYALQSLMSCPALVSPAKSVAWVAYPPVVWPINVTYMMGGALAVARTALLRREVCYLGQV